MRYPPEPPIPPGPVYGRKSLACMPQGNWNSLATSVGSAVPYANSGQVHQGISALMLTDALRRSGF